MNLFEPILCNFLLLTLMLSSQLFLNFNPFSYFPESFPHLFRIHVFSQFALLLINLFFIIPKINIYKQMQ